MRWILLLCVFLLPAGVGCSKRDAGSSPVAMEIAKDGVPKNFHSDAAKKSSPRNPEPAKEFVSAKNAEQAPADPKAEEKKAKPRKIRYTADMKLIVEKLDDAEEALDTARKEAKGDYEKVEVNRSADVVRSGTWRVRVPNENLNSFRKAVAKLGDVERDTIESEDMTAKYYDLEVHITNRKAEQNATREFLVEIGKKDPRYLEVKRELDAISDDIMIKEGRLKLWTNLADLTTFTIHMREKQKFNPPPVPTLEPTASFSDRADKTWTGSWEQFVGFCQAIAIVAIAVTPWLPVLLVCGLGFWLLVRVARRKMVPVAQGKTNDEPRP